MRRLLRGLMDWADNRTGIETAVKNFLYEDIPASSGWHQVFGSIALFVFLVQGFTGVLLAFNYAPQPGDAYYSLQYIIAEITAGRLIRGLHHWGASMMVVVVVLHMVQVGLWGAYKKPREATWIAGIALLLLVVGFGLTGYLLPWDNRAYWATVVTIQIASLAPGAGEYVMRLLGSEDGTVGVTTFSRFYTLHVFILPALTSLLIAVHVYLVRRHGVAPQPRDLARPKKKFYPQQAAKDVVAIFVTFCVLFALASALDAPLERLADPTDLTYIPRPEWYFLFLFQTLKFFEGSLEVIGAVILPTLAVFLLAAVPFLDRGKMKRLADRKIAFAVVGLCVVGWSALTIAAVGDLPVTTEVDKIEMDSPDDWKRLSPVELAGLSCYRQEKCITCHNLGEGDPKVGPTLANISERKSADWMIAHFRNPSQVVPGSPMPAIPLPEESLNCLSAFLLRINDENVRSLENVPNLVIRWARVFQGRNCGNCHVVNGVGIELGPALNGVAERRSREWVEEHFRDPQKLSPGTMMPALDLSSYLFELPNQ